MRYLLDTCVVSELVKQQPDARVVEWIDSVDDDDVYLSVITIGEITKGIEKLAEAKRKQELREWLRDELLARFQGRLVVLDVEMFMLWGALTARLETAGRKLSAIDSLIAASALQGNFILVTRSEADFEATGVKLFNPWKKQ